MFKACFEALKAGGNTVLAYIHSSYGQRELELMENDVDKWISDYGYEQYNTGIMQKVTYDS